MDPIDYARTTRRHAGQSINHGANAPGLIIGAVAVVWLPQTHRGVRETEERRHAASFDEPRPRRPVDRAVRALFVRCV